MATEVKVRKSLSLLGESSLPKTMPLDIQEPVGEELEENSYLGDKIMCIGLLSGAAILICKTLLDFIEGLFR